MLSIPECIVDLLAICLYCTIQFTEKEVFQASCATRLKNFFLCKLRFPGDNFDGLRFLATYSASDEG